jgi:hypothetical protein
MSIFFHEYLYRTDAVIVKLKEFPVTICGAGALGANLTENLARAGFGKLKVIDRGAFGSAKLFALRNGIFQLSLTTVLMWVHSKPKFWKITCIGRSGQK